MLLDHGAVLKNCSGENRTHYLLVMSQAACHLHLAAIKRSIRRTCTGLLSVTDGPQRYLCLDGMKLDVPTGNAPVASVLQTEWFTCSIGHENWSGAWGLHPPGRLHRPECCWLHHHLGTAYGSKMDPPAGVAPAWSSLRKKCIAGSATEE